MPSGDRLAGLRSTKVHISIGKSFRVASKIRVDLFMHHVKQLFGCEWFTQKRSKPVREHPFGHGFIAPRDQNYANVGVDAP